MFINWQGGIRDRRKMVSPVASLRAGHVRDDAGRCFMSQEEPNVERSEPGDKVKQFPTSTGVYLMKDGQGRVLYVGTAKNLRNRRGHYLTEAARDDGRSAHAC